jgi:hypothetical protein
MRLWNMFKITLTIYLHLIDRISFQPAYLLLNIHFQLLSRLMPLTLIVYYPSQVARLQQQIL